MGNINENERSWAIQIISEINYLLKRNNLGIKLAGGENTVSTSNLSKDTGLENTKDKRKTMFPDMLLYADESMSTIIQGWELKMPDTPITNIEFIEDAKRKATVLGLNSFVIWNFNDCHFYLKDENDDFKIVRTWSKELSHINDRTKVMLFQNDWKQVLRGIIFYINEFFQSGEIIDRSLKNIITGNLADAIICDNIGLTAENLRNEVKQNRVIDIKLKVWWDENSKDYINDEDDKYRAYSKILILNWLNKIIFANIIKYYHNPASKVELIVDNTKIEDAINIFEEITNECDFYSIFSPIEFLNLLNSRTWNDIIEFNNFIISKNLNNLEQSTLQDILENTVSMSKREISGQFTTPIKLAELLVKLTMIDTCGDAIDPCCGTGSIAVSLLNLKYENLDVFKAYSSTWASDKYQFPLQIANIAFTKTDAIEIPSKLFNMNVFNLKENEKIYITAPKSGQKIEYKIPKFSTITSNLPFVPFEILSDDDLECINTLVENVKSVTGLTLSKKSDLYAYIILTLWEQLEDNGRLGVIISNSWLGTDWGKTFRSILIQYYNIVEVVGTSCGRWFSNADVVTTILILEKKEISEALPNNKIAFTMINKPIDEIESNPEYLEHIVKNVLLKNNVSDNIISRKEYTISKIKTFEKNDISWNSMFYELDWLYEIVSNKNVITNINKFFKVSRGERRGWDQMFYPEDGSGIEPCYLKNVLKTTRGIENLLVNADGHAFCCSESLDDLKAKNHSGAIAWINKFENMVNGTGKPLKDVLRRKALYWYEMKDDSQAELITSLNPHKKLYIGRLNQKSFINQRLIGLVRLDNTVDLDLCHALLNSIIGMFFIEALGFGRGLGALDINSTNFSQIMMLDPKLLNVSTKNEIIKKFKPLLNRKILETEVEINMPDRIEFDKLVLESYGIEEFYEDIKYSLLTMQKVRLSAKIE